MNSQHPNLSFTMECSRAEEGVPFLDTLVTVETCGNVTKLETELYIKPTNSGIILHSTSAHPKDTKHNIFRNMFHRAYNNSSSQQKEGRSINKIWNLLSENGYSSKLLKKLLREVQRARARRGRGERGRGEGHRERGLDSADGFLTLPYIDEQLLRKVKHIVRKSKLRVRIAWKNDNKLKATLVRSSICKPSCPGGRKCHLCMTDFKGDCTQKNIVYEIRCTRVVGNLRRPPKTCHSSSESWENGDSEYVIRYAGKIRPFLKFQYLHNSRNNFSGRI